MSKQYADALGFNLKRVYIKKIGFLPIPVFLRYIVQAIITVFVLIKNNPRIIAVQNPPIFAVLIVWLYCMFFRRQILIDSHTAGFLDKKWIFFFPIFKFLSLRATLSTCHNYKNLEILKKWGVRNCREISFAVPFYDIGDDSSLKDKRIEFILRSDKKFVLMVNRFASDDDWKLVLRTALKCPETVFFITGEVSDKIKKEIKGVSENVVFTGYLGHSDFIKLMSRCDVILCLTLRKDTKLWSIQETLSLNKPFIFSDTEVLNYYFKDIGISVKHNEEDLKKAIESAFKGGENMKEKIKNFARENKEKFLKEISEINKILNNK